jgi:hypothetical protein
VECNKKHHKNDLVIVKDTQEKDNPALKRSMRTQYTYRFLGDNQWNDNQWNMIILSIPDGRNRLFLVTGNQETIYIKGKRKKANQDYVSLRRVIPFYDTCMHAAMPVIFTSIYPYTVPYHIETIFNVNINATFHSLHVLPPAAIKKKKETSDYAIL